MAYISGGHAPAATSSEHPLLRERRVVKKARELALQYRHFHQQAEAQVVHIDSLFTKLEEKAGGYVAPSSVATNAVADAFAETCRRMAERMIAAEDELAS